MTGDLFDALAGALLGHDRLRRREDDSLRRQASSARSWRRMAARAGRRPGGGDARVKDESEIVLIAAAAKLIDGIYRWLLESGLGGRRERELAVALEHEMRLRGASSPSFDSIVAAGAHGALPHAQPASADRARHARDHRHRRDRRWLLLRRTRTFAVGEPSARRARSTRSWPAPSSPASRRSSPGAAAVDADAAARAVIERPATASISGTASVMASGWRSTRPRALGHKQDAIATANVVTVEPGVYLPGELGCESRIWSWCATSTRRCSARSRRNCSCSTERARRCGERLADAEAVDGRREPPSVAVAGIREAVSACASTRYAPAGTRRSATSRRSPRRQTGARRAAVVSHAAARR